MNDQNKNLADALVDAERAVHVLAAGAHNDSRLVAVCALATGLLITRAIGGVVEILNTIDDQLRALRSTM